MTQDAVSTGQPTFSEGGTRVIRHLRMREVEDVTGWKRSMIYHAIRHHGFPPPIKLGKSSRWRADEVAIWLEQRRAKRDGKAA